MKETRVIMGMPMTVEVLDAGADQGVLDAVFDYFTYVDEKFSTYKESSEISLINRHELALEDASEDMQTIFALAEDLRTATDGYFDIWHAGKFDPSGLVKGWALSNAARMLTQMGYQNFYVEGSGDFQVAGKNDQGQDWRVGIRNPFNMDEIVKVLAISDRGIATSGTYARGQHIYNPHNGDHPIDDILSLTVIGPDVYLADCFATAAFAMGSEGIAFIERLEGFEGYMIDKHRQATFTSGFQSYVSRA